MSHGFQFLSLQCSHPNNVKPLLSRYESHLLPAENKPLEMSVLKKVKELLAEVDARTAAKHITMYDCKVSTPKPTVYPFCNV